MKNIFSLINASEFPKTVSKEIFLAIILKADDLQIIVPKIFGKTVAIF